MKTPYIGYTYCIYFIPTGQAYYGSRCAKNCNPTEFWVKYFTSSKLIHDLIKNYGKDSFIIEIRKTFSNNPKDAQNWERRVLKKINAGKRSDFLNKSNGVVPTLSGWKNPFFGKKHSDYTKRLLSEKAKIRCSDPTKTNMYGKKHSEETKQKFSDDRKNISYEKRYGQERSAEIRKKLSEKLSGTNNPFFGVKRFEMMGELNPMKDEEIRKKHSESIKNRQKYTCPHCDKLMDAGGLTVHKRSLIKKQLWTFD